MSGSLTRLRTLLAVAVVALTIGVATPSSAFVAPGGTSGNMELVAAPPSLAAGALTSDSAIRVINEQQVTLTATVTVLTMTASGWGTPMTLTKGVCLQGHLLHMNRASGASTLSGSVTFNSNIVGVATDINGLLTGALAATDPWFGNPGTTYAPSGRGLEVTIPLSDYASMPNPKQLNVTMRSGSSGDLIDELRVITLCDGPPPVIPEAPLAILLPLTGAAAGGLVFLVARRRPQAAMFTGGSLR